LDSLSTTTSVTIDFINKEVKIRKDSTQENNLKTMQLLIELQSTNDIHVHPDIIFYLFITSIFINDIKVTVASIQVFKYTLQQKLKTSDLLTDNNFNQ
jgi:hypothetical protein